MNTTVAEQDLGGLVADVVQFGQGLLISSSNVLIMLAVYVEKGLHTKEYILPCVLAFCEFWLGVSMVGSTTADFVSVLFAIAPRPRSHLFCIATNPFDHFMIFGTFGSIFTLFCISCDRLVAVSAPMWYFKTMNYQKSKVVGKCVVVFLLWVHVCIVAHALRYYSKIIRACSIFTVFLGPLLKSFLLLRLFASWGCALVYSAVIFLMCFHKGSQSTHSADQMKISKTLSIIIFLNTCLHSIPSTVASVLQSQGKLDGLAPSVIFNLLALNSSCNIVVYMARNKVLRRRVIFLLFCRRKTVGGAVSVVSNAVPKQDIAMTRRSVSVMPHASKAQIG